MINTSEEVMELDTDKQLCPDCGESLTNPYPGEYICEGCGTTSTEDARPIVEPPKLKTLGHNYE